MTQHAAYGPVHGPPKGEMSRRGFMRRVLGVGVGILSLEFIAGSIAFLWPNLTEGLGAEITLGTPADVNGFSAEWQLGLPYVYNQANLFFVNGPAARARVENDGPPAQGIPDPGGDVMALYRKCPHLGCQVPQLCDLSKWFECLCHGSKYTILGEHRDGPAPRGLDRFPVALTDGVYVINTAEIETGPPTGTVGFDPRQTTEMQHCAG
ncbi:MAG: ubiquinol-cytochrome c reductase iron-sulfur subunit [Candidatus Limnocylindria bacterium]